MMQTPVLFARYASCISPAMLTTGKPISMFPWLACTCFEDLPHAVPSSFGSDDHAGIKDYSHVHGVHTARFLMISSISAGEIGIHYRYFSGFLLVLHGQRNALGDGAAERAHG